MKLKYPKILVVRGSSGGSLVSTTHMVELNNCDQKHIEMVSVMLCYFLKVQCCHIVQPI